MVWPFDSRTVKETTKIVNIKEIGAGLLSVTEKLKGKVESALKIVTPKKTEDHFEEYQENELIFKGVPIITGVIDKIVDFSVGPGYYIEGKNKEAVLLAENFAKNHNFDLLLREIIRNMLVYGNAYVEIGMEEEISIEGEETTFTISALKNWDPKFMFVERNEQGEVVRYVQKIFRQEEIEFEPKEIAHFKFNVVGDEPYGTSLIHPLKTIITDKLKLEKAMAKLMERKAGAPYHVRVGGVRGDKYIQGSADDLAAISAELEWIRTEKHEFVTSDIVEMSVIDSGPLGEKFYGVFDHYDHQIIYGSQVPEVLLGKGSIPEGLAKVQMDAFEFRIQSIQLNVEQVLEEKILKPYLQMNGYFEEIDFEWGTKEGEDKEEQLETLGKLLSPSMVLTQQTRTDLENKLRDLLGLAGNVEAPGEPLSTGIGLGQKPFRSEKDGQTT